MSILFRFSKDCKYIKTAPYGLSLSIINEVNQNKGK
jgi:hypothetical protein